MTQSILQEFCSAHDFAEIRKGFPLLHSAIFSSFVGSLQAAILWPRNLQSYDLAICSFTFTCALLFSTANTTLFTWPAYMTFSSTGPLTQAHAILA